MKSNVTKFAAAAATIVIVAGLALITLNGSTQPVYALGQTIEANRCLKCFHIRINPQNFGSLNEAWGQFDDNGELLILRMDFHDTVDGPKVVVWEEDKAEVWFKKKKSAVVVREKNMTDRLRDNLQAFDPRLAMEKLYDAETQGKVTIETQEPSAAGEPITLIVSFNGDPNRQEVYTVNPETKLVEQIEAYRLNGDEYDTLGVCRRWSDFAVETFNAPQEFARFRSVAANEFVVGQNQFGSAVVLDENWR